MYKIIVSPRAQREIEDALDFLALNSYVAPKNFIQALKETYDSLTISPFHRVRYKNIRALKLHKFPYSLFFIIDKEKQIIRVLSCFHNKRSAKNKPRY